MLGNYKDAKARPPLPLRFCIYRAQGEKELTHASSKHPFMLYALKASFKVFFSVFGLPSHALPLFVSKTGMSHSHDEK